MEERWCKVVFLIDTLGAGGAERCLADSLPRFRDRGIEGRVIRLGHVEDGVEQEIRAAGFDVIGVNGYGRLGKLRSLRSVFARQRPDIVHTALFNADILGRLASARRGIPVISSLVNTSYERIRLHDPNVRWSRLTAARFLDGWTARTLTAHFHAVSNSAKHSAVRCLGISPEKITVVERGHDPQRLGEPTAERRARARRIFELEDDDEVVVNVARQEYQKGQKYLLEAANQLSGRRPRLRVLVAGREGHATDELSRLRDALGLEGTVRFLGHITNVPDLLAAADVFAFPSLYEGLGNALIEAMAMCLPVVVSDAPALQEIVSHGHNGIIVPVESTTALAEAISTLLDDRERARALGGRSRESFLRRFTLDRYIREMVDLYRHVTHRTAA